MADICTDNRFEVIKEYKQKLIECTNIETAQDEMAVIDDILFRFWQMGWIPVTQPERKQVEIEYTEWNEELWGASAICGNCGCTWQIANNGEDNFCPNCGTQMIREEEEKQSEKDLVSRKEATRHLKKRLMETALNNVGIKENADYVYSEMAENRIDIWMDELPAVQPEPTYKEGFIDGARWATEIHDRLMDETGGKAVYKNEHWGRGENNDE